MYPGLREDHLRYLQKWGLIRPVMRTHTETYFPFSDLLLIRQVSSELASAPFRTILRSLQAERSGQLTFDFRIDAEPARIIKLKRPKPREIGKEPGKETVVPMAAPQTLAEEYFIEGISARRGRIPPQRGGDVVSQGARDRSVSRAGDHQPCQHSLRQGRAGRSPGVVRARDRPRPRFFRGALQPRQHLPRPRPLSRKRRRCYRTALRLNGQYADAHFYLAITLEKTGHSLEAKPHWRAYQTLSPNGEWVELAREFSE